MLRGFKKIGRDVSKGYADLVNSDFVKRIQEQNEKDYSEFKPFEQNI